MPVYPSGGTIAQSAGSPGFGPAPTPSFNASASVRFNPADTPSFGYVPTVAGNRQTFTFSAWVKRSLLGAAQTFFGQNTDTNNHGFFEFQANDALRISSNLAGSQVIQLITTQFFRDPSQWYNIVIVFDLLNSTQADRVRLFVNGVRVTAFSTNTLPANITTITTFNAAGVQHYIGRYAASSIQYFGGYLADVNLVDGLALTPSSFTATDANTGQLVPAQYTGAFGINGFYLPLSSAALAVDLGQNPKTTNQDYPYWKNNTLLVDTTNTNGQQNNSFTDSAQFGIGITRNGNTTQGTVSPFYLGSGTEQANGYYSGVFDGNGDFINFSNRSIAGSFTAECWFWRGANVPQYHTIFSGSNTTNPNANNTQLTVANTGAVTLVLAGTAVISLAGTAVAQYQWNHIAYVRSGTSCAIFVNGQRVGTGTSSLAFNVDRIGTAGGQAAGAYDARGFISNARITDSAVYNPALTSITVPTAPLTAIDPTQLLTCQSSVFSDNSLNNSVITPNGNAQPVQNNPFGMTAWSGYFDGTGDFISIPSSSQLSLTGDFTIEMFFSMNNATSGVAQGFIANGANSFSGTATALIFGHSSGPTKLSFFAYNILTGTTPVLQSSTTIVSNQWYHVAITRSGTSLLLFVNGQQEASYSSSATINLNTTLTKLASYWGGDLNGYISNARVVKGTAVYTANFTPPTAPLTAIANTSLLTCQSSTFIDNSPNAFAVTVNGNSSTLTLINPFNSPVNYTTPPPNGYGLYFNGVNENTYVSVPISITFGLTSNHVIEFDYFCDDLADHSSTSSTASQQLFTFGSFTTYLNVGIDVNGQIAGNYRADTINNVFSSANGVIGAQQWYRIRWQKIGTAMSLFVNNVQVTSTVTITAGALTFTSVALGRFFYNAGSLFNGWALGKMANLTITQNGVPLLDTFRSPYLRDFSSNNYVITLNGVCSTVPLSPTMPTSAYNAVSMGGSAYFDGTGDYLTLANSAFLQLGSNSFTVEGWFYFASSSVADPLYVLNSATSYAALRLQRDTASTISVYISNNGSSWANQITNIGSFAVNAWNHIAVTREGTTGLIRVYQNGTLIGSATNASALHAGTVNYINAIQSGGSPVAGFVKYISGFRVLIGRNLYPSSFTPPVAPPTNILLTNFLANFTSAGIYDATGQNVLETVGTAQVTTAVKKFGESSISFDGSGDYIVQPTSSSYGYGTGDFTIEFWLYLNTTSLQTIVSNLSSGTSTNPHLYINGTIRYFTANADRITGASLNITTWYHIAVCRVSGSTRLFINGTQSGSTYADANNYGATAPLGIGTYWVSGVPYTLNTLSGYIQDLRISKVGRYSGNFTPPAAAFAYNQYDIGNQQWLPTNISVTAGVGQDNLVDSPSDYGTDTGLGGQVRGNYCTWNPLKNSTTLSNGNLSSVNTSTTQWLGVAGTFGMTSGQWYWECTPTVGPTSVIGLSNSSYNTGGHPGADANSWGYYDGTGNKYFNGAASAYGASFTTNDVIGVAFDADAGTLTFYKNGASQGVAFSGLTSGPYFPACGVLNSTNLNINAGQRAFSYTAPTGFKCLVSGNLPTENSIGATSTTQADNYFDLALYTGNGTTQSVLLPGQGFTPDFTWIKSRSTATEWHVLCDSLRGPNKLIYSNSDAAEATVTNVLNSFDSGGFSVGYNSAYTSARVNTNTATYVGWAWRGGGSTGVTNTNGSITSTISANTTSGFSVVRYTGTGVNDTVGHGLGKQLKFIMVKELGNTDSWIVWHTAILGTQYLVLNTEALAATAAGVWNSTVPSSSAPYVFSVGTNTAVNQSGQQYVAYCFTEIPSFSSMGTYAGNNAADGPFIYTGFRPAYVLIKTTNFGGAGANWVIKDDLRAGSYNPATGNLYANLAFAEDVTATVHVDLLSNGFKLRGNYAGINGPYTYMYVAFAESPFKYSRAR
jgi:hypothetical protein